MEEPPLVRREGERSGAPPRPGLLPDTGPCPGSALLAAVAAPLASRAGCPPAGAGHGAGLTHRPPGLFGAGASCEEPEMAGSPWADVPQAAEAPQNTRAFPGKLCSVVCGHDRASPGSSPPCSQRPALTALPEGEGPVRPPCAKQEQPEQAAAGVFALFPSVQVAFTW